MKEGNKVLKTNSRKKMIRYLFQSLKLEIGNKKIIKFNTRLFLSQIQI